MKHPARKRSRSISITDPAWRRLCEDAERSVGVRSVSELIVNRSLHPRPDVCSCYRDVAEIIHSFLAQRTVRDEMASVAALKLHRAYQRWCRSRLLKPVSADVFISTFLHEFPQTHVGERIRGDRSTLVIFGSRLRQ